MALLTRIKGPRDLDRLSPEQLDQLAEEIRTFLVDAVSKTGGHLGPNLGVVELTIALHRVFDSPEDRVLWDTGHQSYVHKLLTGRQDFSRLQEQGRPVRLPLARRVRARRHREQPRLHRAGLGRRPRQGQRGAAARDDHVVAVIGDGALTGGMAWEALNNIAAAKDRPLVIVVNDNERSYAPTIGGLANHLATLRTTDGYERFLARGKDLLERTPVVGKPLYETLHGAKKGLKDFIAPQGMFEDLGLKYVGPIDGHDIEAVESALHRAKRFRGPVIVHCLTEKGRGYQPAARRTRPTASTPSARSTRDTGLPHRRLRRRLDLGLRRRDGQARRGARGHRRHHRRHAAAGRPDEVRRAPSRTGSTTSASPSSTRAVSAAGLATGGLHPVVAVYATFLNRAFDQVLMDVALHKCGVTFVLDRAGVTGTDGASHNGMWDMSILQVVPGLRIAAPRDADQVRAQLREAVEVDDAPTVVRFSKGAVGPAVPAVGRIGGMDVLREPGGRRAPTCCWSRSARWPRCAWRSPTCSTRRASPPPWSTRAGSSRSTRRCPRSPRGTGWSSPSRTTAVPAASARPSPRRCATPGSTYRCATSASRSVPRPRLPQGGHGRDRPDRPGHRPPGHRPGRHARRPATSTAEADSASPSGTDPRRAPIGPVAHSARWWDRPSASA